MANGPYNSLIFIHSLKSIFNRKSMKISCKCPALSYFQYKIQQNRLLQQKHLFGFSTFFHILYESTRSISAASVSFPSVCSSTFALRLLVSNSIPCTMLLLHPSLKSNAIPLHPVPCSIENGIHKRDFIES